MEIIFKKGKLREWRPGDEPALVKYADNRKIWINLDDIFPHPYTLKDAGWWIRHANEKPGTNFAIINDTGPIGGIGLEMRDGIHRLSASIGYWLGEPFWGMGIATASLGAMVKYAFSSLNLVRLHAIVFDWNTASCRVLEKNGFKREGTLRKSIIKDNHMIDAHLYALIRPD